jgi:hypothetical protein
LNGFGGHFVKNHSKTVQNWTQTTFLSGFRMVGPFENRTGHISSASLDHFGINIIFDITMKRSRLGRTIPFYKENKNIFIEKWSRLAKYLFGSHLILTI